MMCYPLDGLKPEVVAARCKGLIVFVIKIPGKSGALSIRYPSASAALDKLREMHADGIIEIVVQNAKGDLVTLDELGAVATNAIQET